MTTTIKNELGEFTADTEAEALVLVRRAKQKARRDEKKRNTNHRQAQLIAESHGFDVLAKIVEGVPMPDAWRVYVPSDRMFPSHTVRDGCYNDYVVFNGDSGGDGYGTLSIYKSTHRNEVKAVLYMGAIGHTVAWINIDGELKTFAIGVYGGCVNITIMPDVSMDLFRKSNAVESAKH